MQRREFVVGLSAAIAAPLRAGAQELPRLQLVGFLDDGAVEDFLHRQVEFRKGLAAVDYFEGEAVVIETHRGRLQNWAGELVDRGAAVLVASGSLAAILAAKAATMSIPIVFGFAGDPVAAGIVSSLEHPDGNITGFTAMPSGVGAKRLGLLADLAPLATRVAVLVDPSENAAVQSAFADVQEAAGPIGREIALFYAREVGDFEAAFRGLAQKRCEVLFVGPSSFFASHRPEIVALAAQHRVPALYCERDFVKVGGLMSYGPSDLYRLLGVYAGRILSGQKPAEMPVGRTARLQFVVNLKTAKALGLTIPQPLLASADEVIQ